MLWKLIVFVLTMSNSFCSYHVKFLVFCVTVFCLAEYHILLSLLCASPWVSLGSLFWWDSCRPLGSTLNSAYNEVAFNEKSPITKENLCTKYTPFTYEHIILNEKPPITKQNLCIFFFIIGRVECSFSHILHLSFQKPGIFLACTSFHSTDILVILHELLTFSFGGFMHFTMSESVFMYAC